MKDSKMSKENLECYLSQPKDIKYALFHNFIDLAKLHYNKLMEEKLRQKVREKFERWRRYNRWGKNPGSIRIGEEKVPVEVPRLYDKEAERTEESRYHQRLHKFQCQAKK